MAEEKKANEQSSEETKSEEIKVEEVKVEETNKEDKKEASTTESCCGSGDGEMCEKGKNIFVWLIIIVLVIGAVIFFSQRNADNGGEAKAVNEKTSEEIKSATLELVEGNLVAPGTSIEVGAITEESGLYKIELTVEGQEVTSYMTKDKTKFIPQLIETEELNGEDVEDKTNEQASAPAAVVTTKSDKPEIELFVMSHCPYGTQMEKGILPVLDVLGDSVDMKFKFVDYAMHGEKEVKEEMRQYCIEETTPNKFQDYLGCFLAGTNGSEEEAKACMTKLQINNAVVAQCEKTIDAKYNILALLKDKASWVSGQFPQFNIHKEDGEKYGVQGSPTLVINGEQVQSGRDSASILAAVCSSFNEPPAACDEALSATAPAPGFGTGVDTSGASEAAGCGA